MAGEQNQIDPVSQLLGELKAEVAAISRAQAAAREDSRDIANKLEKLSADVAGVKTDVATVKTDVGGVKTDISDMKPTVKLVNEARLKALGVIAGLSMLSGVLGSYLKDRLIGS